MSLIADELVLNGAQLLYLLDDLLMKCNHVFKSGKQSFGFRTAGSDDSTGYEKLDHFGSESFIKLTLSLVPSLLNSLSDIAAHLEVSWGTATFCTHLFKYK